MPSVAPQPVITIEQMVRDLLTQSIKEGLVAPAKDEWDDPDPQCRSAGELVGVANMLNEFLGRRKSAPKPEAKSLAEWIRGLKIAAMFDGVDQELYTKVNFARNDALEAAARLAEEAEPALVPGKAEHIEAIRNRAESNVARLGERCPIERCHAPMVTLEHDPAYKICTNMRTPHAWYQPAGAEVPTFPLNAIAPIQAYLAAMSDLRSVLAEVSRLAAALAEKEAKLEGAGLAVEVAEAPPLVEPKRDKPE